MLEELSRVWLVGHSDGPEHLLFHQINNIAVDDYANLYVVSSGTNSIRVFDSDGGFLREFGRSGDGPGEFVRATDAFVREDTVVVLDAARRRLVFFTNAGEYLESWPMYGQQGRALIPVAPADSGWLVSIMTPSQPPLGDGVVMHRVITIAFVASLRTARLDTLIPQTLLEISGGRTYGLATSDGLTTADPLFEPRPGRGVDGRGNIYIHYGAPYTIDQFDSNGQLKRRISRVHEPIPISDAIVASYERRVQAYWDTARVPGGVVIQEAADMAGVRLQHVATLPPLGSLHISRNGAIWVQRPDLVKDPAALEWSRSPSSAASGDRDRAPLPPWDVFDAQGRLLATIQLPPRFSIKAVGDNWVVGVERDDLGVQRVAKYELRRH